MKKIKTLLVGMLFIALSGCDINDTPIKLTASNSITKDIDLSVAQTSGTPFSLDIRETINIADVASNVADVTDVKINSISYKYKDFTGNEAGRIQSVLLKIDNVVLVQEANVDVFSETDNAVIHQVTDTAKLTKLEQVLLSDKETQLAVIGSILSDAGAMNFKMEVSISLTVTLKS